MLGYSDNLDEQVVHDEALGEPSHKWSKGRCNTVLEVRPPAKLASLIVAGWQSCTFQHEAAPGEADDGRIEVQTAQVRYEWSTSRLYLKAYAKKFNDENDWIKR